MVPPVELHGSSTGKHSLSLLVNMLASLGVDDGLLGEDHKPVIKAIESCVFLSFHAKKKSYNLRDLDMLESAAEDFVHDTQTAFRSVLANGQYNKPKAYTCSTLTASTASLACFAVTSYIVQPWP